MLNTYDCSPTPVPERLTAHVSRVVHNIFHPHHIQHRLLAPVVLACHVPEMETVTVMATPELPPGVFPPTDQPRYSGGGYAYSGGYVGGFAGGGGSIGTPMKAVSVDEPLGVLVLAPVLIAMIVIGHFRRER